MRSLNLRKRAVLEGSPFLDAAFGFAGLLAIAVRCWVLQKAFLLTGMYQKEWSLVFEFFNDLLPLISLWSGSSFDCLPSFFNLKVFFPQSAFYWNRNNCSYVPLNRPSYPRMWFLRCPSTIITISRASFVINIIKNCSRVFLKECEIFLPFYAWRGWC